MPDYLRAALVSFTCVLLLWGLFALVRRAKSGDPPESP
jgi:hypothetical protein